MNPNTVFCQCVDWFITKYGCTLAEDREMDLTAMAADWLLLMGFEVLTSCLFCSITYASLSGHPITNKDTINIGVRILNHSLDRLIAVGGRIKPLDPKLPRAPKRPRQKCQGSEATPCQDEGPSGETNTPATQETRHLRFGWEEGVWERKPPKKGPNQPNPWHGRCPMGCPPVPMPPTQEEVGTIPSMGPNPRRPPTDTKSQARDTTPISCPPPLTPPTRGEAGIVPPMGPEP